jgi:hypothetical protein
MLVRTILPINLVGSTQLRTTKRFQCMSRRTSVTVNRNTASRYRKVEDKIGRGDGGLNASSMWSLKCATAL